MSDDFDVEPIPGLPQRLPAGERILWQGAPHRRATLLRMSYLGWVAVYFAALLAWGVVDAMLEGAAAGTALASLSYLLPVALLALAVLAVLGHVVARSTVYTITTHRIVMRFGIALPMAVNFPFRLIASAAVKAWPDGTGNIPLQLRKGARVGYIVQSTMNVSADDLMRLGMDMQDEVDQDIMDDDGNEDAAGDMEVDGGGDDGDDDAVAIVSPQNGNKRIKATGSEAKNPKLYRCEHQTSCRGRMCALTSFFRFVL